MSLLEHVQGSREALSALAQTPAQQRKSKEIRAFVAELMPVLRDVRGQGHGFRRIVTVLEKEKGVRIAKTTLERHFKALEKQGSVPALPVSKPYSVGLEIHVSALREGSVYALKRRDKAEERAKNALYSGKQADGAHIFLLADAEGKFVREKPFSPDALCHYEIRSCES